MRCLCIGYALLMGSLLTMYFREGGYCWQFVIRTRVCIWLKMMHDEDEVKLLGNA